MSVFRSLNWLSTEPLKFLSKTAIDAFAEYSTFYQAFGEYIEFDFKRRTKVIPQEAIGRLYESLGFLRVNIANYAKCLVEAIGK